MRGLLPYFVIWGVLFVALAWITGQTPQPGTFHVEPRLEKVAHDGVTIRWDTPTDLPGKVEYGPTDKLGSSLDEPALVRSHEIRLEGLEPATRYWYRVNSGELVSKVRTFTTGKAPPSFHVEPYLQLPAPDAMTIMWETTEKMPGRVEYGPTEQLGQVVEEKAATGLHQVRLAGLKPGTPCYYRVRSGSLASRVQRFRTAPPPGTTKWRMAVYGDSRSNPAMHRKVVDQIAKHNVDLILHTGDIVADGKNYASWRKEFFTPLQPIAGSVPWVSTIGNHERDSQNYFSYAALPGNERFFGFDFANARIVCLDSNGWIEKGRDSKQYEWMEKELRGPRGTTWTFIAFHHPLFSAHRTRPINPLRWDWAPLFVDPGCRVDGVLAGHDHFYARNHLMARAGDEPRQGVLFMTTAGGGASLYPIRERDYLASIKSVHHFTLFDFDGDQATITPIDIQGKVFDRYVLKKQPTPPEEVCAYEVEELKEFLRKTLVAAPPTVIATGKPTSIDTILEVPTRFQVPVAGKLRWEPADGWFFHATETPFSLKVKEPLAIPLRAMIDPKGMGTSPKLTIEFDAGRFRNRTIELYPFKLTGPAKAPVTRIARCSVDGVLDDNAWSKIEPLQLLPTTAGSKAAADQIRLATDGQSLFLAAQIGDATGEIKVTPPTTAQEPSGLVLRSEHVRIELNDGKETWVFALSAENIPYHSVGGLQSQRTIPAKAVGVTGGWTAEMAIPLEVFPDRSKLRVNVVHRTGGTGQEFELRPTFDLGTNPDIIPDWKAGTKPERFATLQWPPG